MKDNKLIADLIELLRQLDATKIHYRLACFRAGAIAVEVAVPGERWEIEFLEDGTIEIECFRSDGTIHDGTILDDLFSRFSD